MLLLSSDLTIQQITCLENVKFHSLLEYFIYLHLSIADDGGWRAGGGIKLSACLGGYCYSIIHTLYVFHNFIS